MAGFRLLESWVYYDGLANQMQRQRRLGNLTPVEFVPAGSNRHLEAA